MPEPITDAKTAKSTVSKILKSDDSTRGESTAGWSFVYLAPTELAGFPPAKTHKNSLVTLLANPLMPGGHVDKRSTAKGLPKRNCIVWDVPQSPASARGARAWASAVAKAQASVGRATTRPRAATAKASAKRSSARA